MYADKSYLLDIVHWRALASENWVLQVEVSFYLEQAAVRKR